MKNIKIKMALAINESACLFIKENEKGLFLGNLKHYKTLGIYTGNDLIKLCNNENSYIFYTIFDILKDADIEQKQNKLDEIFCKLQDD